jgi:hypothetical protein
MCSRLSRRLSSCSDRTRFPGQKRKPHRSRQQIRAGAAYGDLPSWSSVKTLVRDRVNIACLLCNPTPSDAAWRSFATRWRLGAREPEAERSGSDSRRIRSAALTGTPTAPVKTRSAHRGQGHVLREPLPVSHRYLRGPLGEPTRWAIGITMRDSDRAWVALAGGVAAYDLIATDDEQVTNAARRYFKSQPIATASMILVTGLQLVGGIPPWCNSITLTFAAW